MRVAVVVEKRFVVRPDGSAWTDDQFERSFWGRYMSVFDQVAIVARADAGGAQDERYRRVDGDGVFLAALPHYVGPTQFVRSIPGIVRGLRSAFSEVDAVILRSPGPLANVAMGPIRSLGLPFGVEVVGDPHDVFAPGASRHPLRRLFRWWFAEGLRQQCSAADVASYVTESALQKRYPPGAHSMSTHYSSVELGPNAFSPVPRCAGSEGPYVIVNVATFDQPYKAVDTQLLALQQLLAMGLEVELRIVGDGRLRGELEAMAHSLGLSHAVRFLGRMPGAEAVRPVLDRANLFWLPSRTEGLPRALIEAMARGLPAIGTDVGGIPELLPREALVPVDDVEQLAGLTYRFLTDPAYMDSMARANLEKAREYSDLILSKRRDMAYSHLRRIAYSKNNNIKG